MRAKLRTTAGQLEEGTTAEIVAKAEAETGVQQPAASPGSAAVEYTLRDEQGQEETVNTRDFEMLP